MVSSKGGMTMTKGDGQDSRERKTRENKGRKWWRDEK